ncbi:MAG: drug resistance transporter, drug:H+ antiporter-2 family protein [Betaproteobacteria bacterium]|nr:drug resistance transporter, drug:H+ antiporter-2 family protein [Betaproteobacteria bacterium]
MPFLPTERSLGILLGLVAVGFFMQTLDSTIVNTALPAMAASLGESPLRMQSVVISYSLTMAVLIPASGWLADRYGTKRIFLGAIVLFTIGSVLCAISTHLNQLVASRILQGAGGAMLLPVGRLALLRTFPRERLLQAMSVVSIPGLIGPLIGPTLGGWLVQIASWDWIFLVNVPVGIIGCIATYYYMPDARNPEVGRFDFFGYLLLGFGMAMVSLALNGLSDLGLPHAAVMVLLIFGLACIVAYWLRASKQEHPLFSPALFKVSSFAIGLLGNLFARIGSGAMPFLIPLLLQLTLGYTPFQAGLMMLPVAAAGIASKGVVRQLIARFGYRTVLVANTVLVGLGIAEFALVSSSQPVWVHLVQLGLFGGVNSIQFTAMNTICLKDLDSDGASAGNSLLSMVQMLSISVGVMIASALLRAFADLTHSASTLSAFHATFICMGLITSASGWIFWQLSPDEKPSDKPLDPTDVE